MRGADPEVRSWVWAFIYLEGDPRKHVCTGKAERSTDGTLKGDSPPGLMGSGTVGATEKPRHTLQHEDEDYGRLCGGSQASLAESSPRHMTLVSPLPGC